jgi:DNA-3-methyladenine glycosylase
MAERRGPVVRRRDGAVDPRLLCGGPARLTQALAIGRAQNGLPSWREPLVVLPRPGVAPDDSATWSGSAPEIVATPRVGVGDDPLPWRFVDARSTFLSRPLRRA